MTISASRGKNRKNFVVGRVKDRASRNKTAIDPWLRRIRKEDVRDAGVCWCLCTCVA